MKGILLILILATTFSCLSSRPYKAPDSDPTVLVPSVDHGTIVIEEQAVNLSYCDLLVDRFTMYWCSNQLFVMKTDSTTNLPSTIQMEDRFVMSVHADDSIILKVGPRSIDVVREFELIKQFYFHSELLLMARVKAKPSYFILATIIKNTTPKGGNLTHTLPESPYYISIYLEGAMPTMHKMSFPVEKFDFAFTDNSFRDAIIYSDPWYGHSYFIVSLEKTWISVFKMPFESSQIRFSFTRQLLESDWEILEMKICENYLFLLAESKRIKGSFKALSYRIQTSQNGDIGLEKEGEIYLDNFLSSSTYIPQLKVKLLDEVFLVMLNVPGEKMVLYYYQKPLYESFSLGSLSGPFEIVYKNSVGSNKIGYSFDYMKKQQGFSLTPISPGLKQIYFIPYCMPNFYRHPTRGCVRCESGGFSFGANAALCQSCSPENLEKLTQQNTMMGLVEAKCPRQCEEKDKFGKMCLPCMDEMNRLTAKSLSKQEWRVDLKGDCELYCELPSVPHPQLGRCVDERTLDIFTDNCAQMTDCVECSLTQTCSWENGSCRQRIRNPKISILEDFLKPASMCSKGMDLCGEVDLAGSSGYISFSSNSIERRSLFCKWNIKAQNNDKNKIELRIILETPKGNHRNVVPAIYYESIDHHTSNTNVFSALEVSNGIAHKNLVASEVVLYTMMDQYGNQETPVKVRIEYRIRPSNDFVEGVLILFRWIYYVIFLFLITLFVLTVAQKIINYCQKRRLIRDLEEFHGVDEIAEGEHQKLKIESVLKSNKVMCKIVYEDEKSNKYEQTECSICLEDFNKGDNLAKFSCDHIFHIKCFESWVKLSDFYGHIKCAVCNRIIV